MNGGEAKIRKKSLIPLLVLPFYLFKNQITIVIQDQVEEI